MLFHKSHLISSTLRNFQRSGMNSREHVLPPSLLCPCFPFLRFEFPQKYVILLLEYGCWFVSLQQLLMAQKNAKNSIFSLPILLNWGLKFGLSHRVQEGQVFFPFPPPHKPRSMRNHSLPLFHYFSQGCGADICKVLPAHSVWAIML